MVSLKLLRLDNNEIECNCNIFWLLKLLKKSTYIEANLACKYPEHLKGKTLSDLTEADLDCSKWRENFVYEFR